MNRRKFLVNGSLSLCAVGLSKSTFASNFTSPIFEKSQTITEDRVLVIIRLNGGNDGLNTVTPIDQYDNLIIQRPDILIPEANLLTLNGFDLALHPKMPGMQQLFNGGELAILQNVDAPSTRSHFRATDVWLSGIEELSHPESSTGWMGRILDNEYPGFPANYPNATHQDPFAITFGTTPSGACEGGESNFSHPVLDPSNVSNVSGGTTLGIPNSYHADHIQYLSFLGDQMNSYNAEISNANSLGNTMSMNYGTDDISLSMQSIAKLISGGLESKIYVVEVGGFDTHSNQVDAADVAEGRHAILWEKISTAITAFQEDMNLLGLNERVLGITFSEFGRQIAQNGSKGTDHGDAAVMFMFGSCITNQVIGTNPVISDVVDSGDGLDQEIDYRDVYSTILKDWFGVVDNDIIQNFEDYGGVNYLNLVDPCSSVGLNESEKSQLNVKLYPNPSNGQMYLEMNLPAGNAYFVIVDLSGKEIGSFERNIPFSGIHNLIVPAESLSNGVYFLRIRSKEIDKKVRFIIQ
jgi:uncharacterized protein (DUF1501 family)